MTKKVSEELNERVRKILAVVKEEQSVIQRLIKELDKK